QRKAGQTDHGFGTNAPEREEAATREPNTVLRTVACLRLPTVARDLTFEVPLSVGVGNQW
ncbi:hypothetical protein CSUI_008734, partial [Cystoisospora suis]